MKNICLLALLLVFSGCAVLDQVPSPEQVVNTPLGTDTIKIGMTKDQVTEIWGEPDYVEMEKIPQSGREREVWTYRARYSMVPINAGYLSKDRRLYFDGNNLTEISK